MRRFEVVSAEGPVTVEIEANTILAVMHGWTHPEHTVTAEIPEELRRAFATIEQFSERPDFRIEWDDIETVDDAGNALDLEPVLKFYDDAHGGGFIWCFIGTNEVIWGTSRGKITFREDGTIRREDPAAAGEHRTSRHDA